MKRSENKDSGFVTFLKRAVEVIDLFEDKLEIFWVELIAKTKLKNFNDKNIFIINSNFRAIFRKY